MVKKFLPFLIMGLFLVALFGILFKLKFITPDIFTAQKNRTCLSKFQVDRSIESKSEPEIFTMTYFHTFKSGAFFGKIANFKPGQNEQFGKFINQPMQEKKISTYRHLRADVCLQYQNLVNPQDGTTLKYYVEHYYCTNSCQEGKYEIQVELNTDGTFVGYQNSI